MYVLAHDTSIHIIFSITATIFYISSIIVAVVCSVLFVKDIELWVSLMEFILED